MKVKILYRFSIPLVILCIWTISSYIVSPIFLASPYDVLVESINSIKNGDIFYDITYTLYRVCIGFILAVVVGIPIGLSMGYSNSIYNSFEFTVEFFRSIPVTALFPLFFLLFGIGDISKFAITAWGAGLIIIINSMYGVHLSKKLRRRVAYTMNIQGYQLFRYIIFPEALPNIFSGLRIGLSLSLIIVIVTEMFIGTHFGLGKRIIDAQLVYNMPDMYSTILITGIVGFFVNMSMIRLEKRIVHWNGR